MAIKAQAGEDVLSVADSMPKFPGGNLGIGKFFVANMIVPAEALEGSKAEKTFVKFVIDTFGKVQNPMVIKPSAYKSFDAEAIRIISKMPLWTPGLDKNKKVKVYMILPVSYKDLGIVAAPPSTPEHDKAMKYWNEGHKLEQQQYYEKALEKFDLSLSVEAENKFALYDKAKMHFNLKDKTKACEVWNKMLTLNLRKNEVEEAIKKNCN